MYPVSLKVNNYNNNIKNATVYTPRWLSNFLLELSINHLDCADVMYRREFIKKVKTPIIVDSSVGSGNLLRPFKEYYGDDIITVGFDIHNDMNRKYTDRFIQKNWLEVTEQDFKNLKLLPTDVIFSVHNPPFNNEDCKFNKKAFKEDGYKLCMQCDWHKEYCMKYFIKKNKLGRPLLPELFIKKAFELFPHTASYLITPMGFRLNQRLKSDRWRDFGLLSNKITSILSLPIDAFEKVQFHCEVLFWNVAQIAPHNWLPLNYIQYEYNKIKDMIDTN